MLFQSVYFDYYVLFLIVLAFTISSVVFIVFIKLWMMQDIMNISIIQSLILSIITTLFTITIFSYIYLNFETPTIFDGVKGLEIYLFFPYIITYFACNFFSELSLFFFLVFIIYSFLFLIFIREFYQSRGY